MLKIIYLKRFLIVSMLILLTACDSKLTQKEIAVDKIASYAENGVPPVPTVLDYRNAGVYSVTDKNLNDINFKITQLVYADVDTTIEIQHVVNSIVVVENHIQPPKKDKIVQKEESKVSNKPIHVKEISKKTNQNNEKKEEVVSPTKEEQDTKIPNKPLVLEHVPKTTTNDSVTIQIFGEAGSSVLINTKKVDTIPADGKLVLELNTSGDSGIKHFNIVLKDKAGNKSEVLVVSIQKVETLEDITKPIITLQGSNPQIIELGSEYTELGATTNDGSPVEIDSTKVDTNTVGTYTVTYTAKDASNNKADKVTRTIKVEDTTKPIITLQGSNPQTIELGTSYTELGATTNDGSAVKIDATAVDTTKVGTYTVTYTATDAQGNQADKVTRTVKVEDTTKPIITIQGSNLQTIELGSDYTELGATTNDGSPIEIDSTKVDTNTVGTYTVTYNATDASNNQADKVTRTVKVEDTTKPIITLQGANPQIIELGTSYTELGAKTDDGSAIEIDSSKVDTNTVGTYTVTYTAKDASNNKADTVTRTVKVEDTTKPIITLLGSNPQILELGSDYIELWATTNDGSPIEIDSTKVDTNTVGTYTVTYTAIDAQGNQADTVTRTVKVEDTTKPIITLQGSNPQTIELGSDYAELGASTNDGSIVEINATVVDTTKVGTYTVTYNAKDAQNNQAETVIRTVKVEDTTKPIITLLGSNPQILELGSEYVELGAKTDDGSIVEINTTVVDTTKVGTYTVTYNATDAQGNQADTVTRTVKVETSKPILKSKKSMLYSNNTISVQIDNVPELGIARPWMGIYEVGEPSTFEHMVYYQFIDQAVDEKLYLTEFKTESKDALSRYKNIQENTQYELRKVALVKGKYVTYTSEEITVQPIHAQQVNYRFFSDGNAISSRDLDTHSGEYSLKINNKEKSIQSEWEGDNILVNNAKVLTFSGWSKSENVSSNALYALDFRVTFDDGNNTWYYENTKFDTGTHDWQEVTITTQFNKPVVSVRPYAILHNGTGTVWFDDISVSEGNEISEDIKNAYYTNTISVEIDKDSEPNSLRPWVGIYEVGEPSTFEHMVYYQFADSVTTDEGQLNLTEVRPESKDALSRYKNIQEDTQYELRMVALIDGEYITYATKEITVQPSKYRDEIHKSFDEYYEEYKSSIPKALTKDENGNSNTYILYNLQTYMQSAIIYADENEDIEIIEKLLELVKIPFEEQYMTDGKWLNNKYQVGKEMILPISQYFSLLTRVLSAAQRHGIDVTLTQKEQNIIIEHIDRWINETTVKYTGGIADTHLFFNQSAMLFYDYARHKGITIPNIGVWKKYVQGYKRLTFDKFTKKDTCVSKPSEQNCIVLSRLEMKSSYLDYKYSGYGAETTRDDMFGEDGMAKLPPKTLDTISTDVSHARRFNWYFETVKRFGVPFGIYVSDDILQGWANNLAYRVSRGTSKNPYFTNFSDGQDGWFRVNYDSGTGIPRKNFGYAPGDMDIHFVSGSYGMFGVYNPKIYTWIENWINNHPYFMGTNYYSGRILDYYTSMSVNMKNGLLK